MKNKDDLWVVSVAILNMNSFPGDDVISKDFYFSSKEKAEQCFQYFKSKKQVCGLSIDRFLDTIELDKPYEIEYLKDSDFDME